MGGGLAFSPILQKEGWWGLCGRNPNTEEEVVNCRDWLPRIHPHSPNSDGLSGLSRPTMRVSGRGCVGAGHRSIAAEVEPLSRAEMGGSLWVLGRQTVQESNHPPWLLSLSHQTTESVAGDEPRRGERNQKREEEGRRGRERRWEVRRGQTEDQHHHHQGLVPCQVG